LAKRDTISDLQHVYAYVRAEAAARAGRMPPGEPETRAVLPHLVDRLSDTHPEVRMIAAVSLERLTGRRLGYSPHDPPEDRRAAMARWRAMLTADRSQAPPGESEDSDSKDVSDAPRQ
jgi:hypothetical protein